MVQKRDDARHFLKYLHPDLGVGTIHMIYSLMFLCISTVVHFFQFVYDDSPFQNLFFTS